MRLVSQMTSCCSRSTTDIEVSSDTRKFQDEKGSRLQVRYLIAFACFLANAVSYIMRVNLSVAIVAMTYDEHGDLPSGPPGVPIYDWDASVRSTILSSFFWGYIVTQVPFGYVGQRFGPRYPLLASIVLSSVATILYVPAASLGWGWACASRVILGLAQGALLPCCHALLSRWSLPSERGRMTVYSYTGQQFGTVLAMSCSGVLSAWAGWPWVFYVTGGLGLALAVAWLWIVADSPAKHHLISPRERILIETKIAEADGEQKQDTPLTTPWRSILTSTPVWALIVVHSVQNWGFWTLLTEIPSYMNGVLHFNLAANGLLSALPYLTMWVFGLVLSWISDLLLSKKYYSVGTSRKLGNSLAHYGSALGLIVLGFVGANQTTAVAILTVSVAVSAGTMIGYQVNYIDLSPNFAGTIMGIGNGLSNIMSILGPLLVGLIVTNTSDVEQWRTVFLIAAGFYIVGNSFFVIFGSGEVQPWNSPDFSKNKSVANNQEANREPKDA